MLRSPLLSPGRWLGGDFDQRRQRRTRTRRIAQLAVLFPHIVGERGEEAEIDVHRLIACRIRPAGDMAEQRAECGFGRGRGRGQGTAGKFGGGEARGDKADRSEEHTSELQSLMRISYAVFCLKKKKSK